MGWEVRSIERTLENQLKKSLGEATGQEYYSRYVDARKKVIEEISPYIRGAVPSLTDHGPEHIANVLDNVERLLGDKTLALQAIELYALLVSVLFHDLGNLYGRERHNQNISDIYSYVRSNQESFNSEKAIILKIAGAHTGYAQDGSKDTLKSISSSMFLDGYKINAQSLAAILRFADELAEGPQRTSEYMQSRHQCPPNAAIYHAYSSITNVNIDRASGRIALTYHISLDLINDQLVRPTSPELTVEMLVEYIHKRVAKLDEERKYAKYYCNLLSEFKETSMNMTFWLGETLMDLEMAPLVLSDLTVPDQPEDECPEKNPLYNPEAVGKRLLEKSREVK